MNCAFPLLTFSKRILSTMSSAGNRLRFEKSPYLLQHAHNPIDWFTFGEEAIEKSRREDKPIFLSVGYATCHWCHVMEKESFESDEVAAIMNQHFVSIKVDREERPDIDKIYMKFLLMVNRSGGWPMSIWLTPDLSPITAGTYFPPENRWGVPGFKTVLRHIAEKWTDEREELLATGQKVIRIMQKSVDGDGEEGEETGGTVESKFNEALKIFKYSLDKEWGGFGGAPKFPEVSKLNFMLQGYAMTGDKTLLEAVTKTLRRIAYGGIHDHVFGGFSRYAVDRRWHVPHFEKMLYDQAQLLSIYARTFQLTCDPFFMDQCEKTFAYLISDLRHSGGAFFSGEDADSLPTAASAHKIEGSFYAWTFEEIEGVFEANRQKFPECADVDLNLRIFCDHFDVKEEGNVAPEDDPQGHFLEKNILFMRRPLTEKETEEKYPSVNVREIIRVGCEVLHEERKTRPRPELDTKLICSWNGLMLTGLCHLTAAAWDNDVKRASYLKCAQELVDFARSHFYCADTKTLRRSCYGDAMEGSRRIPGFLDDYSFLIRGLLAFYHVSQDESVLIWAKELQETQDRLFWDAVKFGYFYTEEGSANVVLRLKEDHDGAEPCGNSVAVTNLLQLNEYFDDEQMREKSRKCVEYFRSQGSLGYPMPELLCGASLLDRGIDTVIIVGPDGSDATNNLLRTVQRAFVPGLILFHAKPNERHTLFRESFKEYKMENDLPTAYICRNRVCQLPITDPMELLKALQSPAEENK